MKKAYMHTIDDQPGFFSGEQICFLPRARTKNVLRYSLQEIKADQKATLEFRQALGCKAETARYSWRMFYV